MTRRNVFYFNCSRQIKGVGIWLDFIPAIAVQEVSFVLHFDLLWVRFWWIKYKTGK
jgi:hypothetical protein